MSIVIGVIGATLIVIAWVFGIAKAVKRHKSLIDLQFAFISLIGSLFLGTYSYLIGDVIFIGLSVAITASIAFEIVYSIHVKKIHRRRR